jgi:cytoskeletal protein RodZ
MARDHVVRILRFHPGVAVGVLLLNMVACEGRPSEGRPSASPISNPQQSEPEVAETASSASPSVAESASTEPSAAPSPETGQHKPRPTRPQSDIETKYQSAVARSNACQKATDCAVISPGCPLGCWSAVNAANAGQILHVAEQLRNEQKKPIGNCMYKCTAKPEPNCVNGQCTFQ